jgi:hypothetical protein
MRTFYPYLQDSRLRRYVRQQQQYNILAGIKNFPNRKIYTKITLLDWNENPIKSIEGEIVSGNQSKDGASSVRRVCNLSCTLNGGSYSIDDINMDFSINKKVFVEIGVLNELDEYPEYPILWFPQGVFFINSLGMSSSTTGGVNLNLSFKDKMCMLNGDLGGKFGSTVVFDVMDTQLPDGKYVEEKVLLYNIVQELVNHYGGEDLNNILIDIPLRIKRVMRWTGSNLLYAQQILDADNGENFSYIYTTNINELDSGNSNDSDNPDDPNNPESPPILVFHNGDDVGYVWDDFFYTGELVAGPAETITSILDKIKNYLGNYEYYYDVHGIFHFEEIRNYVNTTLGKFVLDNINENDYFIELSDKSIYCFESDEITSITVTPQYENIRNDFIVQGLRQSTNSQLSYPIMYHLAIDSKPDIIKEQWKLLHKYKNPAKADDNNEPEYIYDTENIPLNDYHYGVYYNIIIYQEPETKLQKAACVLKNENNQETWPPEVGNFNLVYYVPEVKVSDENGNEITEDQYQYWDGQVYQKVILYEDFRKSVEGLRPEGYFCKDWRTKLYMDGVVATVNGTDPGYYYPELSAYWPQVYDLVNQCFFGEPGSFDFGNPDAEYRFTSDGIYYLDFIEPIASPLGRYSVQNIGRRTHVTVNDKINCLFQPEIPNIVFINIDESLETKKKLKEESEANQQPWTQVRGEIYGALATGGYHNGAFDQIKYDLYCYTNYKKTISMTTLPIYWIEPNSRIKIYESTTDTYGDYMISNINYNFGASSTMTVACSEVFERF